jgi:hypothetical protein
MGMNIAHSPTNQLQMDKRILIAIVGFVIASVVGATSLVGAQANGKPTKQWCEQNGFRNYGQCVKEWAHNKGYGYGQS